MPPDDLLVTFRSQLGVSASPACVLRIQVPEGEEAAQVENYLAEAVASRSELRSRTVPHGVCFELVGSYGTILKFLAVDDGLQKTTEFATKSLKRRLQDAAAEAIRSWRRTEYELELPRDRRWRLGRGAAILGILNVTPDSFSDGGRYLRAEQAIEHGLRMVEEGADAVDVGGESTRPGAESVSVEEEVRRVAPVIAGLRGRTDCPISVDTSKAEVARVALEEGADIINDVTSLGGDPAMAPLLSERKVPVVLMHMQGRPPTMQDDPKYEDPVAEILHYLWRRVEDLTRCGIERRRTIVDPGIGFGKRSSDNLNLIRDMNELRSLGRPVLMGVSRKSFLGSVLGGSVEEREAGTLVANAFCALGGAAILRTHHIGNAVEMKKLLAALWGSE